MMQLPQIQGRGGDDSGRWRVSSYGEQPMPWEISVRVRRSEAQLREQGPGAAPDLERDGEAGPGVGLHCPRI